MVKTAVVILNWNTQQQLKTFLPPLINFSSGPDVEIIVADNASTDNSVEFVRNGFPQIRIICLDKNYGFAEGYNRALKQIDAEYYIIINSDIEVTKDWLTPLVSVLEENDEIKACMPKLLSYHDRSKFEYAGAAGGFIDFLGYPFCKGRIFDHLETDEGQYDGIHEIFWATGACIAIKSDIFHKLNGFDPYFFAHMEEIDLCWRIKNLGYKIVCNSNSHVFHVGGGTLHKSNPHKTYLNFRNNLILLHKNLPLSRRLYIFPLRYIMNFLSIIKYIRANNKPDAHAVFRAYLGFFRYLLTKKQKVDIIQYPSNIYKKSIVVAFFLKKKLTFNDLNFNK